MTAAAQRNFANQIASIEMADSVAMMAGHQVGAIRQYNGRLQQGVDRLEEDVMDSFLVFTSSPRFSTRWPPGS